MNPKIDEDEISLVEIYSTLAKSKKLIITLALFGAVLGGGLTILLKPRLYESSCLMRLGVVLDRPIEPMDRLTEVLKEPNTVLEIAKRLKLDITKKDTVEKLKKKQSYSNRAGMLEINARNKNAPESVRHVNAISQFILDRHALYFQYYQKLYKGQLSDILNVYKSNPLNVDARTLPLVTEPTEIMVPPVEPKFPLKRGAAKNAGFGFSFGLLMGVIWSFLRKGLGRT